MGLLTQLLRKAVEVVGLIGGKPKFTDAIMYVVTWIPEIVSQIRGVGEMSTKEKIDEALRTVDDMTGTDKGAIDVVRNLPADKEEELFDYLVEVIRILAYNKIKLDGYYIDESGTRSEDVGPAVESGGDGGATRSKSGDCA